MFISPIIIFIQMRSFFIGIFILLMVSPVLAQYTVKGSVKDGNEPLIGATIKIVGTSDGVIADYDGNFTIEVPESSAIAISFIGYKTQEFSINRDQTLNVVLEPNYNELDEVVVIGYGTIKKSDLTGSVSSVKGEDFIKTAVSSLDQGLQGKAAGVVVSMASGQPGARSSTRIRGTTSIIGTNEPLYVIDGVILIEDGGGTGAVTGPTLNPLENINPEDVESIEVLKDASATAIYGARGANGVILVTTKRGSSNKSQVSVSYSQSIQELRRKIPLLNAAELAILANEAADNAGVPRNVIYASPTNLGVGTDWQDEIFDLAPMTKIHIAARGGNKDSNYSISGGFLDQKGILINSQYTRANVRINLDQKLGEKIKVGTSTTVSRSKLIGTVTDAEAAIPSSVTSWALTFNPGLPVRDANGNYTFENNTSQPAVGNPVQDALENKQQTIATRLLGNFYLQWDLNKWLSLKSSASVQLNFIEEKSFTPNNILRGEASNGQAVLGETSGVNQLLENTLSFNRTFGNHSFSGVIGHTIQEIRSELIFLATSDFEDNRLGFNSVQVGKLKTFVGNGGSSERMQSFLGRINYTLADKYLFTASARVDGSTKFGAGNKWGFFPSLAFAWRVKDESFLSGVEQISDLKLRVGYGVVGNQGILPYSSQGLLETTEAYFGENEIAKGFGHASRQNDKLKWEQTYQYDIGIDAGFFNNRLSLTADWYYKKTVDLLVPIPLPYTSGFNLGVFNIGTMENKGFELAINTVNMVSPVEWRSTVTMGWNRNKILKLNREEGIFAENMLGVAGWTSVEEGMPINSFYGYETAGIAQLDEDLSSIPHFTTNNIQYGDRKYVDQNNDDVIDERDIVLLGNAHPDFSYGFNNTFTYKAFALSIFIQGVFGNEIVNFNKFGLESFNGLQNNSRVALERWTPENPSNTYPRATLDPRPNVLSDHQVEDGSYLRVKDITFSYDFSKMIKAEWRPSQLRLSISAKNLFTITNYSGYDPEINRFVADALRFGADNGSYPTAKIYSASLNVIF